MDKYGEQMVYQFEEFSLDAAQRMLYRAGEEVPLTPKAVETLLVLVEKRGRIVGKNELMRAIWKDAAVEESNLAQYLHILRKTLGSRSDGKPFIETFKRRGYRFNGEVALAEIPATQNGKNGKSATSRSEFVAVNRTNQQTSNYKYFYALVVLVGLSALAAFSFYRFNSAVNVETKPKAEIAFFHLTNGNEVLAATISPDGRYFVYHEQDAEAARLWLQQTGQENRAEIIPATARKIFGKTFSPDSQSVYFVAQDAPDAPTTLYRVPIIGGEQTKILTDINSPVSFSPDGRQMVFVRWNKEANEFLLVAAAANGDGERVLVRRAGQERITLESPAWSPDGRLIAFGALDVRNAGHGDCSIVALDLESGKMKALSPEKWDNCFRMAWTPGGEGLVFVGTKFGEAFSTRRDQIYYLSYPGGEARRLTTDGSRHRFDSLGVTEKNEILAVPFNNLSQIWTLDASGDSRTARQKTTGLTDGRNGIAPLDEGRVGYLARSGDGYGIWLMNADGSERRQINLDEPNLEGLKASPDGRFFIFSVKRDGRHHLYRINSDGANLRQLTSGDGLEVYSTISPDGNWVVFDSATFDGETWRYALRKMPVGGGEPILLTDKHCRAPLFSPDGRFISCVGLGNQINVLNAETGALVKTFSPAERPINHPGARWTPDGRGLMYIVQRKNVSNLWLQPLDGARPRPLTDFTSGDIYNFEYSADGNRLYVARGYPIRNAVLIKNFID